MDNDTIWLSEGIGEPVQLSEGEYGAAEGLSRIMRLHDRYDIPASFFIPVAVGLLYPQLVAELKRRPQHEVGVHGWIHESPLEIHDRDIEEKLLRKEIAFWTEAIGRRPVGYRAPSWQFSPHTLDLLRSVGFEYDSSAMAMDEPYEIISNGRTTGLLELPVEWMLDDAPYLWLKGGALPSAELTFKVYQAEFDQAYESGTMFMLTMHPMITGHRSYILYLDRLIAYMKSKPGVWFATAGEISKYIKRQEGMVP